ncbi:MAG: 50S ribosomal protein L28 [Halanaerobiales bacterium]|nr:50S ribosomal protein L28 [Halanaerobiales bacterium]
MAQVCQVCGKSGVKARSIVRRGKAKRLGGVGRKVTGISLRTQKPNLKRVKAIVNGSPQRVRVCTNCLKSGRVERAL